MQPLLYLNKMNEYIILTDKCTFELEKSVQQSLDKGFTLAGGTFYNSLLNKYGQALVKLK